MTGWAGSTRRATLPTDWAWRRRTIAERAGWRCEMWTKFGRCPYPGHECDHIADRANHELWNLQWLCRECHRQKTIRERPVHKERRDPEAHPGLI